MAPRDILADLPPRQRPKNEIADLWDALQSYANRTGEHFMGGLEQNAQGFGDIYERGAVHTGIPRMAFGGLASLGAPVSAALEPLLSPYLAPAMQKMNEYVGKPIEASTGYPADLANEIALLPLGALGKVAKHAVPRLASMGDAIGNAFGPDMPLAGAVRGTFIGPMAKNFPKGLLNYAEKMVSEGNTPQEIFRSTGLFKGADGKWRKEIDDSVATMNFGDDNAPLHQPRSIKSVLQHKELYDNYPDLVNADVTKITGSGGQLQQAFDLLDIDDTPIHTNINVGDAAKLAADVPTKQSHQKGVLLHELQHYIQQREGWNRGGSTSDFTYQNSPLFDQRGSTESALDAYKRLAGEVEARNTQARRGLSKEDRAAMIPLLTEDVPRDRQIVHYGRAEPQSIDPKSPLSSSIRGSGPVPTRTFYRGTNNSGLKLDEPFSEARGLTFVARSPDSAKMYGENIEEITAKPGAKILDDESPEFWKLIGRRRPPNGFVGSARGGTVAVVNDAIAKAKAAGYDAVSFSSDSDIGTVLINEGAFNRGSSAIRGSGPVPTKPQSSLSEGITAYHGSPHSFDKFDMSKIGTGEGAQAYGHGLYFAESPDVARQYRTAMEHGNPDVFIGKDHLADVHDKLMDAKEMDKARALEFYHDGGDPMFVNSKAAHLTPETLEWFNNEILPQINRSGGKMYQVKINVKPDELLDWDKPLSEQPKSVQGFFKAQSASAQRLKPSGDEGSVMSSALKMNEGSWADIDLVINNDGALYNKVIDIAKRRGEVIDNDTSSPGEWFVKRHRQYLNALNDTGDVSRMVKGQEQAMKAAGIKGIRYKDAGSRGADGGTYNYVVFDDSLITILKKYGIPMTAGAGGAMMVAGGDMPPDIASQMGGT